MDKKESLICNNCGESIGSLELPKKDYIKVKKEWGYFSKKDLTIHEFILCESCYDKMVKEFKIDPKINVNSEAI